MSANFNDIKPVYQYDEFTNYAKVNKPYRGSNYEYPLGARRYARRHFKPELDGVDQVFHDDWYRHGLPVDAFYHGKLGTFYPDNTFEFRREGRTNYYDQGHREVISALLPGTLATRTTHGGAVFTHRGTKKSVPVFVGLRIRLCDGLPMQDYVLKVNKLDQKLTKPFRAEYDAKFKVALVMLKGMGEDGIIRELKELWDEIRPQLYNVTVFNAFDAYAPNDPAGAALSMALRYNINDCNYRLGEPQQSWGMEFFRRAMKPEVLIKNVKVRFYKELYKNILDKGGNIFSVKHYKYGDDIPTMEWGHDILVDGVPQHRFV